MNPLKSVARGSLFALALISFAAGSVHADEKAGHNPSPGQMVDALNAVFGEDPGTRPVHTKGVVVKGSFTPSASATELSKAPHFKTSVPVTVRFSNFAGIPDVSDTHPLSMPRGMAIMFHLPDGSATSIVAHSTNDFPSPTVADFRDLLLAIAHSGPDAPKPTPLHQYLGDHPAAKEFLTAPKPFPVSYATLPYFAVNAYEFTDAHGESVYGRYQLIPVAGEHYLTKEQVAQAGPDYQVKEIRQRIAAGPVKFKLVVQIAEEGDVIDNPTVTWPDSRETVTIGTIKLTSLVEDNAAAQDALVFMPATVPPGIEVADPMLKKRDAIYAVSFSRRSQ